MDAAKRNKSKITECQEVCDDLGISMSDLDEAKRRALLDHVERNRFLRLLKSLKGNFVRARWRGVDITPKDLK